MFRRSFVLWLVSFLIVFNSHSEAKVGVLNEKCQTNPALQLVAYHTFFSDPVAALKLKLESYNASVMSVKTSNKTLQNRYLDKINEISIQLKKTGNFSKAREKQAETWAASNSATLDRMNAKNSRSVTCSLDVQIWGQITKTDVETLNSIVSGYANPPFIHAYLNSKGGSIDAAIEIGTLIRKHFGLTFVDEYVKDGMKSEGCYSACVLIYAGGIARTVAYDWDRRASIPIGVHAHYFSKSDLAKMSIDQSLNAIRASTRKIERYFSDLGINQDLLTFSKSIPSNRMHHLSHEELKRFLPYAVHEYRTVLVPKREEAEDCLPIIFEPLGACYYKMMIESSEKLGPNQNLLDYVLEFEKVMIENSEKLRWLRFFSGSGYYLEQGEREQGLTY